MTIPSVHPTVSYLVKCYVSGISALQRAVLYLVVITYLSFTSTGTESNSFLANTKNPLNQYFVKYAWGWTFSAVCLLMVLTNYISTGSWVSIRTIRSFCRLAVGTAVWYVFTQVIFLFLEEATGVCEVSEFLKKKTCSKAGHFWRGFDTSGHCFLLSWNNLFMVEEFKGLLKLNITPVTTVTQHQKSNKQQSQVTRHLQSDLAPYLEYLSCGLAVLMMLGEVMMVCTSLYFHTLPEKVLGTLCGLLPWFVMYRRVYQGSWHPGHAW
eukprot:GFUD01125997.1.p1 GENE.GFUD01125997.1~~GFUD01125997.1.p1  ORF type:complete len:266 (+),score=53.66 GFUD01125997.1:42-839(+)